MRIPTYWFCFLSVYVAFLLLPTPVFYNGRFHGFVILATWYLAMQESRWLLGLHVMLATMVACVWTRRLSRSSKHSTHTQRGVRWLFAYMTFSAAVFAMLRYFHLEMLTTTIFLVPIVVDFFLPWMVCASARITDEL